MMTQYLAQTSLTDRQVKNEKDKEEHKCQIPRVESAFSLIAVLLMAMT